MAKIEKEVQKFIRTYQIGSSCLWKVSLPDGHGGQIRKQGFLEKKDATDFATKMFLQVLQHQKGLKVTVSNVTFADYCLQWLEVKKRDGISDAALLRYAQEIRIRLNPFFGHFKMTDLEKAHLRNFIYDLQTRGCSSSIVNFAVGLFKSIIRQAETDDVITSKGIILIKTPKHRQKVAKYWDYSQTTYFLNAVASNKLKSLWKFALFTGLRAGEIAGLKWDCVHLDSKLGDYTGFIEVKRSFNQKTRCMQEFTKNRDRRLVPILKEVEPILRSFSTKREGEYVFSNGEPLDSSHFNRQLQAAIATLPSNQIPRIPFHGLRHSFCSYLDSSGMPRRIVAEIMGHRDLNTTNRYSHVNNQVLGHEISRWVNIQSQQKTNNLQAVI